MKLVQRLTNILSLSEVVDYGVSNPFDPTLNHDQFLIKESE